LLVHTFYFTLRTSLLVLLSKLWSLSCHIRSSQTPAAQNQRT